MSERKTGARFLAETLKGYGITHVFFVEAILRKTLVELEDLGAQGGGKFRQVADENCDTWLTKYSTSLSLSSTSLL